jgi:hypothetical protein
VTLTNIVEAQDWERIWAPYDEETYTAVLEQLEPDDVVLDIGTGDLRLARRMAERAHHVYAWEIQADILAGCNYSLSDNLTVSCTDARTEPIPPNVTVAVLLMRHCRHFAHYAKKLRMAGCRYLLTNARWGMGVEIVDLQARRQLYSSLKMGWYACWCGQTGFKPGPAELLTVERETAVHEVIFCPNCRYNEL